ncbi:hypothetical protein Glove_812864g2 [Diversispora epigaea]|uniref:Restriction endonuclease domain-containing protein n=1 Tax=Diversispora epigaea TaxID=1348612 RepID=A0A397G326_9GLOM|nr:hypothetical protein Glove_812864g2 [Diversispora epigaea]
MQIRKKELTYGNSEATFSKNINKISIETVSDSGYYKWTNYKVSVYELPSKLHEFCINAIIKYFNKSCSDADNTNARIIGCGATLPAPSGSDRENEPWPNIVIEVAYSESIDHIIKKVKNYWLKDFSHMHNVIVVKIDPVPENRMSSRTQFEFGTLDGAGNLLNISRGVCLINIDLNCLYYQARSDVRILRYLPNPIVMDFSIIQDEISMFMMFNKTDDLRNYRIAYSYICNISM